MYVAFGEQFPADRLARPALEEHVVGQDDPHHAFDGK